MGIYQSVSLTLCSIYFYIESFPEILKLCLYSTQIASVCKHLMSCPVICPLIYLFPQLNCELKDRYYLNPPSIFSTKQQHNMRSIQICLINWGTQNKITEKNWIKVNHKRNDSLWSSNSLWFKYEWNTLYSLDSQNYQNKKIYHFEWNLDKWASHSKDQEIPQVWASVHSLLENESSDL